jgi:hypothetical protein
VLKIRKASALSPEECSTAVGCGKVYEQVGEEVAGVGVQAPPAKTYPGMEVQ